MRDTTIAQETERKMRTGFYILVLLRCNNSCVLAGWKVGRGRKGIKVEQERRAIRVRRRRRETEDTNSCGVRDSDHLLFEYSCTHTQRMK